MLRERKKTSREMRFSPSSSRPPLFQRPHSPLFLSLPLLAHAKTRQTITKQQIIADLDAVAPWERLSKRRVAHFVSRFDYASRGADKGGAPAPALPPRARAAVDRVLEEAVAPGRSFGGENGGGERRGAADSDGGEGGRSSPFSDDDDDDDDANETRGGPASADQITVNDYPPGSGIAPHVDTHSAFTERFASLSLGAGVALELRRGAEAADLWLPRRSLLLLGGEARLGWAHYIAPRRGDSVSREAAGVDAEVARAVALAEEKERERAAEEEEEEKERAAAAEEEKARAAEEEEEERVSCGRGGGGGVSAAASQPLPSTTVVIPRRRRISITIRQVRRRQKERERERERGRNRVFSPPERKKKRTPC